MTLTHRVRRASLAIVLASTTAALGACSVAKPDSGGSAPQSAGASQSQDAASASSKGDAATSSSAGEAGVFGPDSVPAAKEGEPLEIAFFGFARANSFASATFAGIEEYAKGHNASAEFFDSNFDGQKQASQIQDAVTSGRFDVFIVQANDGTAVVPPIEQAVAGGKTVVVEFTPIGTRYDTVEPQVDGVVNLVDVPTENGTSLGELGLAACKKAGADPCKVAYLEGMKSLPLDNARTQAVKAVLEKGGAQVVASVEGGYTNETGRTAMQDVLQAHPDVSVVIGSSQAVAGAAAAAPAGSKIAFIGNGGSRQAIDAVKSGKWFGTICTPEKRAGATAAALGLAKARGVEVPAATLHSALSPVQGVCTQENSADIVGEYDE